MLIPWREEFYAFDKCSHTRRRSSATLHRARIRQCSYLSAKDTSAGEPTTADVAVFHANHGDDERMTYPIKSLPLLQHFSGREPGGRLPFQGLTSLYPLAL